MTGHLVRADLVAEILSERPDDLLVVCGLGSPSYDVVMLGDDPRNFYMWGAMGQAVPVGLGLAIARPQNRVLVVTGDGELLMGVGSLSTVGDKAPRNLAVLVLDNEQYAETGGQQTHTAGRTDLTSVAAGMGFRKASTISTASEITAAKKALMVDDGPSLVVAKVAPSKYGPPPDAYIRFGHYMAARFRMTATGEGEASLS